MYNKNQFLILLTIKLMMTELTCKILTENKEIQSISPNVEAFNSKNLEG